MWSALSDLPPPPEPPAACGPRRPRSSARERPAAAAAAAKTKSPATPVATAGPTDADWDAFSQRRLLVAFSRGTAVLPGFPAAGAQDPAARRVVNVELWNAYWSAFSDRFADHIDAVQEQIAAQTGPRRVLIAASLAEGSTMEYFMEQLARYAREFGALEYIARERVVVILQFTCTCAAEAFSAWASSLALAELQGGDEAVNDAGRLFARLVAHDTSRVSATVRLGESILLSTAFVEGVFKGIFDAVQVIYEPASGSFLITFESTAAATIAVHSLQRSLLDIFGLSLVFLDETQQPYK